MRRPTRSRLGTLLRETLVLLILVSYLGLTFGFSLIAPRKIGSSPARETACCCCGTERCADGKCCCAGEDEPADGLKVRWRLPGFDSKCQGDTPDDSTSAEPSISVPPKEAPRFAPENCGQIALLPTPFHSLDETPPGPPPRG